MPLKGVYSNNKQSKERSFLNEIDPTFNFIEYPFIHALFIITPVTLLIHTFKLPQIILFIATHQLTPTNPNRLWINISSKCLLQRYLFFGYYLDSIWVRLIIVDIFCGNPNNFSRSSIIRFETFLS